jgi:hypothetical protein
MFFTGAADELDPVVRIGRGGGRARARARARAGARARAKGGAGYGTKNYEGRGQGSDQGKGKGKDQDKGKGKGRGRTTGSSRGDREEGKGRRGPHALSQLLTDLLRHDGGTTKYPITPDGWTAVDVVLRHPHAAEYSAADILTEVRTNTKGRFTVTSWPDLADGRQQVAAWSGHTIEG